MASINIYFKEDYNPSNPIKNTVVISNETKTIVDILPYLLNICNISSIDWLHGAISSMKPLSDSVNVMEFLLPTSSHIEVIYMKLVILLLPTFKVSRHNSASKAIMINNAIKSLKLSSHSLIVLIPEKNDYIFAQVCALGKSFPLYSLKSNNNTKKDGDIIDILILPHRDTATTDDMSILRESIRQNIINIRNAQRLVDMPPNLLHTTSYVQYALEVAASLGEDCETKVIVGKELDQLGFGGLYGVGQASEHPPALVVLSYYPKDVDKGVTSICMVGKGIVYDTGGLSIKTPTSSMAGMKMDMGGSAAVLCSFAAAVNMDKYSEREKLKVPLHAVLCIAENAVDERSFRPDDVLTMLSGKTVEVNNTDAEGRLVLADGCFYAAKNLNPKVLIDIATLTGAQLIATGKNHAGLYCNDEELELLAVRVGKMSGDLVHPLPYCPEFYKSEFTSKVADMKNSVKDRGNAQSSCAGQFIGNHIENYLNEGGKWLHIDMAGPAWADDRGTGYGVALLSQLVKALNDNV